MVKLRPLLVGGVPGCANIPGGEDCQCWPEWSADNAYTFGDVVQQGGVLYYATRDIPPGTPFIAADWALYRPGATAIPPHNENSSYLQYQPVSYNDKLYTARTDLPPGPFDPANWQEISVEGLVEIADSSTIDFTGTGAAGDPVTATVKFDPDPDNLLSATANGLILTVDDIPFPDPSQILISENVTLRVDVVTGDDATADGTLQRPFATITAAVAASNAGDVILVYPGSYAGGFAPKSNTRIVSIGNHARVTGDVTIAEGVEGVQLDRIDIIGDLILRGSGNGNWFQWCQVRGNISATNLLAGVTRFFRTNFSGTFTVDGGTPTTSIRYENGNNGFTLNMNSGQVAFFLRNMYYMTSIIHAAGQLHVQEIHDIDNFHSSAPAAQYNTLVVTSSSLYSASQGSSGVFSKTGDCRYSFQSFGRVPLTGPEGLPGTKITILNGRDIAGNYAPSYYTLPSGQNLDSHFQGIDEAFEMLQEFSPLGKNVPIDFGFSFTGGWSPSETLGSHVITRETVIPANFEGSAFSTDSSVLEGVLSVMVGASVVGTITITAGVATFASSQFNLDVGQVIRIVSTDEGTFDYAALTLVGHRQVVYVT
nr:MAG TPA: hypothetical protein [Caudoviricetes sp.]